MNEYPSTSQQQIPVPVVPHYLTVMKFTLVQYPLSEEPFPSSLLRELAWCVHGGLSVMLSQMTAQTSHSQSISPDTAHAGNAQTDRLKKSCVCVCVCFCLCVCVCVCVCLCVHVCFRTDICICN